jgi:hypothetical protein
MAWQLPTLVIAVALALNPVTRSRPRKPSAMVNRAVVPSRTATKAKTALRSAQYEWLFWDSAYRLEAWPIAG